MNILNGKSTGRRLVMVVGKYEPKKQWRKTLKLQTENLKWISAYLTYKVDTKSQMYR